MILGSLMNYELNQTSSNRYSEYRMVYQGKKFDLSESSQMRYNQSKNYDSSQSEFSHLQVMVRLHDNLSLNKIKEIGKFDSSISQSQIRQVSYHKTYCYCQAILYKFRIL